MIPRIFFDVPEREAYWHRFDIGTPFVAEGFLMSTDGRIAVLAPESAFAAWGQLCPIATRKAAGFRTRIRCSSIGMIWLTRGSRRASTCRNGLMGRSALGVTRMPAGTGRSYRPVGRGARTVTATDGCG